MNSSLAVLSILSLLVGVKVMGSTDLKCTHSAKLDLQLIVDSSGSVGKENFHLLVQEIADDVIGLLDIGKDKTRVSLFKYSSPKVMVEEFNLDAYTDATSLKKAIKAVKFEAGWTMTGEAMERALTHYSAKMRNDKETAKACIVFTDGAATDATKVPAASKAWQEKGVTVFALGIGQGIDAAGLKAITGSAKTFIQVASVKAITEAAKSLLGKVCEEAIIPTKPGGLCILETNIDYWGNDIRWPLVENIEACKKACLGEEKCVGFAFDERLKDGKHTCWLKNKLAMSNRRGHSDVITGHCQKEPCSHEANIDYWGNDIRWPLVENIETCEKTCLGEEKCVGFAFDKNLKDGKYTCWLKNKLANSNRRSLSNVITGHCQKVVEIAKSSKITASSAYNIGLTYSPSTLVDGCKGEKATSSNLNTCCFSTKKSGWVLFQLNKPRFINEVVIYNRVDCCKERLFPFEILVTDEVGHVHKCQGKSFKIGDPEIPSAATNPIRVQCGNLLGNSVKLVGKVNEYMNICEVEIYGY